ncbi:hypothetical protein SEMRO_711_G191200.1 [Seminavis robusta]|uniref:Uncharacterized protein n=1 Tax=Seminavis robusta TaxID=568900 RepID=A0A9N8E636_9STRA|nr:hypothetical protein SEMRO_711_G191200.1 [Seminavis robusta]|eukprot:Sro711_g191200.1 n/a (175) ;mRNA; r:27162-27686
MQFWTAVEVPHSTNGEGVPRPICAKPDSERPRQAHAMASVRWEMYIGSKHHSKGRITLQERHDKKKCIPRFRFLLEAHRISLDGLRVSDAVYFESIRIPITCKWKSDSKDEEVDLDATLLSKNRLGKVVTLEFPPNMFGIKRIQITMTLSGGHIMAEAVKLAEKKRRTILIGGA